MMVDWKLVVTGRESGRATVDVLHTYRDVGRRRQCCNVDVVALTTHRLHLLQHTRGHMKLIHIRVYKKTVFDQL